MVLIKALVAGLRFMGLFGAYGVWWTELGGCDGVQAELVWW